MNYFVKRGEQQYGPYTLAALQQYVAQGNISRQDMARSEAMTDWVEVSTIIGNVAVSAPATFGAAPAANPLAGIAKPSKMHWAVLLLLVIVTFTIFAVIWIFVEASWLRKVRPQSRALYYFLAYLGAAVASAVLGASGHPGALSSALSLTGMVLVLVGVFAMKSDVEEVYATLNRPGVSLSGVMTFFFGVFYIQYHLCEINKIMSGAEMSAAAGAGR